MKYGAQYIKTAIGFIDGYDGLVPLQHYLKGRFATEKKYGSKDRKHISSLCYSYFRLGHFTKDVNTEERIRIALFLLGDKDWEEVFTGEWLMHWNMSLQQKIAFINLPYQQIFSIFPWQGELSDGLNKEAFTLSHLQQPRLFIRLRPGAEISAANKLNEAGVAYERLNEHCYAFANATKLENILELNKDYVVQDLSSQRVGKFLTTSNAQPAKVWDCCAASGGKAIMAYDLLPNINLTVSDVRPSIIHNLRARFKQANISNYQAFIANLSKDSIGRDEKRDKLYDLIICDVPCSGSGTWSRTPEQLYFFKEEAIAHYSHLQRKIVANVIPSLKQGGYLLYITCSVFKRENEDVVSYIKEEFNLTLVEMELLKGYSKQADTMFVALFTTSPL